MSGQVTFANETPMRIGTVTLAVRDLHKVSSYYRDVVGLVSTGAADGKALLGVDGTTLLELEERPDAIPDDPHSAGLFHTAFLMPSRRDLAQWLRHFSGLNLPLDGASDHLVSEAIYLSDPEGNGIEIYADRPRESWRWDESGLAMGTYPLDLRDLLAAGDDAAFLGAPDGARIGHIHLRVGDTGQAEAFYAGVLGMDVTVRVPGATFLSSGGYHHHLGANTWRSRGAGQRHSDAAGLSSFEIEASPEEAAKVRQRLSASATAVDEVDGQLMLSDPWGNRIRLSQAAGHTL